MRPGERVYQCPTHEYAVWAFGLHAAATYGRASGCEVCASAFRSALEQIGWTGDRRGVRTVEI